MGISKYNEEGYLDLTAYEALRDSNKLCVDFPGGHFVIQPEAYFPCSKMLAMTVHLLVKMYSSMSVKETLLGYLAVRERQYQEKAAAYLAKEQAYESGSPEEISNRASRKRMEHMAEKIHMNFRVIAAGKEG